jgi:hypothetical protein
MTTNDAWGPLAGLFGTWEGEDGVDVSFHNATQRLGETTPYRERVTMEAFGPVDNGTQHLWGLDYRMAAWRRKAGGGFEESPFHTEIGYWLWDGEAGQVLRCFMVPRGVTLLAGGTTTATAKTFSLEATVGSETYGILSNQYLAAKARTTNYTCTVVVEQDTFRYESVTTYVHTAGGVIGHTDRNTLRRVR